MEQVETLLPLSSPSPAPTTTVHSPPDAASSNPDTGASIVYTRIPHSNYPPTPLLRLATILLLLLLSLWANYEASKGFDLTILNAPSRTPAARRFNLFFVSNGRAADMALKSSSFIEHIVYPNETFPQKHVRHVTIRLADHNIMNDVVVSNCDNIRAPVPSGEYLIEISPDVMMRKDDIKAAFASALHRGIAYMWLWDGHGTIPQPIMDAMIEYLLVQYNLLPKHYGSTHKSDKTSTIAGVIRRCEARNNGFIARLNNALRDNWDEYAVNDAFSSPSDIMCLSHIVSALENGVLPDGSGLKSELDQAT